MPGGGTGRTLSGKLSPGPSAWAMVKLTPRSSAAIQRYIDPRSFLGSGLRLRRQLMPDGEAAAARGSACVDLPGRPTERKLNAAPAISTALRAKKSNTLARDPVHVQRIPTSCVPSAPTPKVNMNL